MMFEMQNKYHKPVSSFLVHQLSLLDAKSKCQAITTTTIILVTATTTDQVHFISFSTIIN